MLNSNVDFSAAVTSTCTNSFKSSWDLSSDTPFTGMTAQKMYSKAIQ